MSKTRSKTVDPVQNSFGPVEGQGINFLLRFEVYFSGLLRKPELY